MTVTTIHNTPSRSIDSPECRRLMTEDSSIRLIDVRTPGEFESMHIPGSYNVPLDTLPEHAAELATLKHPIVLVCRSGARADQANEALTNENATQLLVLEGGIEAWQSTGGTVNRGDTNKWALDRQVRLVAGSISLAGIAASLIVPQAKWIAGGIGAGLTFSAVSNTCAMGNVLARLPYNKSADHDITDVLIDLRSGKSAT